MPKTRYATEEQIKTATALSKQGYSQNEIAAELGVSKSWMQRRLLPFAPECKRFDMNARRETILNSAAYRSLEPFTGKGVAEETGFTLRQVNNALHAMMKAGLVKRLGHGVWIDDGGICPEPHSECLTVPYWLTVPFSSRPEKSSLSPELLLHSRLASGFYARGRDYLEVAA